MTEKPIATNRQARFNYTILDSLEAGIALKGTEVKSLRSGKANLNDSFARVEGGEIFLYNMHISPYEFGNINNLDPLRPRKLLLHKSQIRKLVGETSAKRLTLVPLRLYFKDGIAKVELALAKGKRQYDKREAIKKREADRELRRRLA
ncbi:MAG: SsrA-binding protein SmpB [Candidatus Omnitrophica bacterium]|nr:SsrA-binding protein SmpB [Candidatus Omnitrophota bacterium]MCM8791137.1 SsrA-binding protein SmpB [Candidatus Omnitrophota bacterium]